MAKGHGLADLKGVDPMDRRIEIEKKERYARELREQMNGGRSQLPRGRPSSDDSDWLSNPSSRPPSGLANVGANVLGTPPRSPMLPSPSSASLSLETGKAESWGTSEKVSQLQAMIHDRLKYLEEQQRQYWEQLQLMSSNDGPAVSAAREAAQAAVHKQCASMRDELLNQVARSVQEAANNAAREAAEVAARQAAQVAQDAVNNAARSIKDDIQQAQEQVLRDAVEKVKQSCRQDMDQALRDAADKIERSCRQDMDALRANIQEGQEQALRDAAEKIERSCRRDMDDLRANISRDQEQALRDAAERIQESCRQDVNGLREQMNRQEDDVAKVKAACAAMEGDVAAVRNDLSKIYKELERLERVKLDRDEFYEQMKQLRQQIEDDVRRAMANMKPEPRKETPPPRKEPPPPAPVAPEPSAAFKKAPKETYVILKATADDSVHYLCDLENALGRGSGCSAVVGQSQSISNQHCSINVSARGAVIKDLGSRNGTWLNDHRVGPHEAVTVESGDAIQFGVDGPSFLFEWGPAAAKLLPREYQAVRNRGRESVGNLAKPPVENAGQSRSRTPVR